MTTEQLLQVKRAFLDALDRAPAERAAWLAMQADLTPAVRERVAAQLRRYDSQPDLAPAVEASDHESRVADGARALDDPETIGPYRVLRRLGEGGMGVVYECEQSVPVRRRVAVKRLKAGMDSAAIVRRFEGERQVLARMGHPAIAQLHDGGVDQAGRPFFVMERIDGQPVTSYADARRLPLEARLRLFVELCRGVEHAHQRGVLHRDLKPANILITEVDGRPLPKIIDFGIAKAVAEDFGGETMHTLHGAVMGTPQYMSPEAAAGSGDLDTRSDVYSLGVVLHELVTGVLPDPAERRATSAGARPPSTHTRAVAAEGIEPQRPSAHFRRGAEGSAARATARAASAASLRRAVQNDLDWIVLRALRVPREERYGSVGALGQDVQRFLAHEPVEAGPPSLGYRLRRAAQRHRTAVLAGAAVALCLVVGAVVSLSFALESVRQQEITRRNLVDAYELLSRTRTNLWFQEGEVSSVAQLGALQGRILAEHVPDFEAQRARFSDMANTSQTVAPAADEWIAYLVGLAEAVPADAVQVIRDLMTELARDLLYGTYAEAAVRAIDAARALSEEVPDVSDGRLYYIGLLSLDAHLAAGQYQHVLERLARYRTAPSGGGETHISLRYRARLGYALVQAGRAAPAGPEREVLLTEAQRQLAATQDRLVELEPKTYGAMLIDSAWIELQTLRQRPDRAEAAQARLRNHENVLVGTLFSRQALGYGPAEDALWSALQALLDAEAASAHVRLAAVQRLHHVARDFDLADNDTRWRAVLRRLAKYTNSYWNQAKDEATHTLCAFAGRIARAHPGAPGFDTACLFHAFSLLMHDEVAAAADCARSGLLQGRGPGVRPACQHLLGWSLVRLGQFDEGLQNLAQGWAWCANGFGPHANDTRNSALEFAVGSAAWRWIDAEAARPRIAALEAELVRDNPQQLRYTFDAAMTWAAALRFDREEVLARAEPLLRSGALRWRTSYWVARALSRVGELERARGCLEALRPSAEAAGPSRLADIDAQLGALWLRHGRRDEAAAAYQRAKELSPGDVWVESGLAAVGAMAVAERAVDGVALPAPVARMLFRADGVLRHSEWHDFEFGDYVTVYRGDAWFAYLQALLRAGRTEDALVRWEAVLADPYSGFDAREGVARFLATADGLDAADRGRALGVARDLSARSDGGSPRIEATLAEAEFATGARTAAIERLQRLRETLQRQTAEWITLAEVEARLAQLGF